MATGKNKKIRVNAPLGEDDWQTRSDFRTLCDAEEIKRDPKRMDKVRAYAQEQMMNAASIATEEDDK